VSQDPNNQNEQYGQAALEFGDALGRLAYVYEKDAEKRKDLLQDIHFELWRSFKGFDGRCSLRTWVYRIAHNVGASHVVKAMRRVDLIETDDLSRLPDDKDYALDFEQIDQLEILMGLIQRLKPGDRQVITLYLEDLDAKDIAEITGLSPSAVATKIHRIKTKLAKLYQKGDGHDKRSIRAQDFVAKPAN